MFEVDHKTVRTEEKKRTKEQLFYHPEKLNKIFGLLALFFLCFKASSKKRIIQTFILYKLFKYLI